MTTRSPSLSFLGCILFLVPARGAEPDKLAQSLKDKGWMVASDGKEVVQLGSPRDPKIAATPEDVAKLALFPKLKVLRLSGDGVTDDSLAVLGKLPALRELRLSCPMVTDAAVKHFQSLTGLTELSLSGTGFTAAGYEKLPVFDKVTKLNLGGDTFLGPVIVQVPIKFPNAVFLDFNHPNKLNDTDLAPLAKMKKAEWIILSGSGSLADGVADTLARMPTLRKIEVGHVGRFTDKGLEKLKELPNLEMLQLGSQGVTDAGMASLAEIPSLRELVLGDPSPITAAGIQHLTKLPKLTKLALQTPSLTDDVMPHIAKMKTLEELDLVSSGFTDAALVGLDALPNLVKLRIGEFYRQPKITDAGLQYLAKLKGLKQLLISDKCQGITAKGVRQLKAAAPKLTVYR